ncbi:MAG TPA: hypothetical protein VHF87_22245 [Methylomirabilota bacterium]|nr:hypothetical protein [Methylomirabilota bacterium]
MAISLGSLAVGATLALVYALGAWLNESDAGERVWTRRRWVSVAAGVSVAYVFVDVLPELAAQHRTFREAAGEGLLFAEQRIYVLALLSFVVLYGLEHIVLASRERRREAAAGAPDPVYWLHLGGFAAYSALIGYLLVERAERGPLALAVYGLAMALHFLIVDHSLREEHGRIYDRGGRWVLATSVLAGWVLGAATPLPEVVFARLFAVLAGGVVITSLKAELPGEREGRFWPFCLGAAAYAVLLFLT